MADGRRISRGEYVPCFRVYFKNMRQKRKRRRFTIDLKNMYLRSSYGQIFFSSSKTPCYKFVVGNLRFVFIRRVFTTRNVYVIHIEDQLRGIHCKSRTFSLPGRKINRVETSSHLGRTINERNLSDGTYVS